MILRLFTSHFHQKLLNKLILISIEISQKKKKKNSNKLFRRYFTSNIKITHEKFEIDVKTNTKKKLALIRKNQFAYESRIES